jgi:UDP-N-acetylmuramate--alanine ligase
MSGLAKLLAQQGKLVTGSDIRPGTVFGELRELGVEVWDGHRPEMVAPADLVVRSSAVPDTDPEYRAALAAGKTVWDRPALLQAMTAAMPAVGLTGTHGKTTSTALAVTAARAAGLDPSFLVGGRLLDLGTGAHLGRDDLFLLEADEAFGTFLDLNLRALLVTNIDVDHLDFYGSFEALEEAFARVASRTGGPVVVGVDNGPGARLAGRISAVTFGPAGGGADWEVGDIEPHRSGVRFGLSGPAGRFQAWVPKPGRHMAINATGVVALLSELGLATDEVVAGLSRFGGLRRRFESRGRHRGVQIVDDYAHHPVEIAATIAAARSQQTGRLVVAFQPHRYSRTAEHKDAFGQALAGADLVYVTDVYAAGEKPVPGVNGQVVARSAEAQGGSVVYVEHRADLASEVAAGLREGDMLLTLGAGDITNLATELAQL